MTTGPTLCLSRNAKEDHHVQLSSHVPSPVRHNDHCDDGPDDLPCDRRSQYHHRSIGGGTAGKKALVGSWVDTVTFPAETGRPPLKSLVTYHGDETLAYSDQGNVTIEPPTVFSSGNGVWTHLKNRTFAYTALGLISDLSGNLIGYLKTRGIYTMSASGNEYSGTTFAEVLDADGNVLFSIEVTNSGQRIRLELP